MKSSYRFIAILLILSLLLTAFPAAVLAADGAGAEGLLTAEQQGEDSNDAQDSLPALTVPDEPDAEVPEATDTDEDGDEDLSGETPERPSEPAPQAGQQVPSEQDESDLDTADEQEPPAVQEESEPVPANEPQRSEEPGVDAVTEQSATADPVDTPDEARRGTPPLRASGSISPPIITTQPTDQYVVNYIGNTVYFTVIASGDSLSYRWQRQINDDCPWQDIDPIFDHAFEGFTTNTLLVKPFYEGEYYYPTVNVRCVVTNAGGQAVSNAARVIPVYKPTIVSQPVSLRVVPGNIACFSVSVKANEGSPSYQWQVSKDGGTTWTNDTGDGSTTDTLRVATNTSMEGYYYRCAITNMAGTTTSGKAKLLFYYVPEITTQPASKTVASGSDAVFFVGATGVGRKYQWQVSKDGGTTWTNSVGTGSTTKTLTVKAYKAMDGYRYRCIISNPAGQSTSKEANLTVAVNPTITAQPSDKLTAPGKTASFTATATGGGLKYRWQVSEDKGKTWRESVSPGNRTKTLNVTGYRSMDGYIYRCIISNPAGSVTTRSVRLTVQTKPTITTQPTAKSVVSGNTAMFKVYASGGALKYQWQVSRDGGDTWVKSVIPGSTTNTLYVTGYRSMNGYRYRCVITNLAGTATTKSVKLTVLTKPAITTQPKARTASPGSTVTFTVLAAGGDLSYQWYVSKKGDGTFERSVSLGNTTKTLTVKAYKSMDGYCYWCVVSNAAGMNISNSVRLTVN